jgi:hypothetical protein
MTIFLLGLERHEQRYTGEWDRHLPGQLRKSASQPVVVIAGDNVAQTTTPGAFLNFAGTNIYKAQQVEEISSLFKGGQVKTGDRFLFTDAWHFGVVAVRYMSDLLGIPVSIIGLWHAGQYDQQDFLGRLGNRQWAAHFEKSVYAACDLNVFATQFHVDMFRTAHEVTLTEKILRAGWPMEYLTTPLAKPASVPKRKLVLFPHRLAPEKQVEIFRDLAASFPAYEFRVCQDEQLTKAEYHALLAQSAAVFSASLQETLGIGLYEGLVFGAVPIAPNRLSYSEMYPLDLLYPSRWTESWDLYRQYKPMLVERIRLALNVSTEPSWCNRASALASAIGKDFFHGESLYASLNRMANPNSSPTHLQK